MPGVIAFLQWLVVELVGRASGFVHVFQPKALNPLQVEFVALVPWRNIV
jgi:hypothetical protein